jgi:hypothetical protein
MGARSRLSSLGYGTTRPKGSIIIGVVRSHCWYFENDEINPNTAMSVSFI